MVSSPVNEGRHAAKVTVRQGDNPIAASGNRNELVALTHEAPGSAYYYRFSTLFPSSFPNVNKWQLFAQWHQEGTTGSPPVEFYVVGNQMRLRVGGGTGTVVWTAPLVRGAWQEFIFHVGWSPDPSVGFVELFVNGKVVVPKRNMATQFARNLNYFKMGLYRDASISQEGILFHDGMVQATQLADVWPASWPALAAPAPRAPSAPLTTPVLPAGAPVPVTSAPGVGDAPEPTPSEDPSVTVAIGSSDPAGPPDEAEPTLLAPGQLEMGLQEADVVGGCGATGARGPDGTALAMLVLAASYTVNRARALRRAAYAKQRVARGGRRPLGR